MKNEYLKYCEQLIQRHVFSSLPTSKSHTRVFSMILLFAGALWGTPWIHAAQSAAVIFSSLSAQHFFHTLFGIGIVVTVGCDGVWVMSQVLKREKNKMTIKQVSVHFCALLSCIPAVYAAYIYNQGIYQSLAAIVFIVNYGYGVYGYSTLFDLKKRMRLVHDLENIKQRLLTSIDHLLHHQNEVTLAQDSAHCLQHLLERHELTDKNRKAFFQEGFKLFFASSVALSLGLVDVYLTKHFLTHHIISHLLIAMVISVITAVPGVVATFISSYFVAMKIVRVFTASKETLSLNHIYPRITQITPWLILLVAFTAPSAAGFITFTTLSREGMSAVATGYATSAMMIARFAFSYFTLSYLSNEVLLFFARKKKDHSVAIENKIKLKNLRDALSNNTFNPDVLQKSLIV